MDYLLWQVEYHGQGWGGQGEGHEPGGGGLRSVSVSGLSRLAGQHDQVPVPVWWLRKLKEKVLFLKFRDVWIRPQILKHWYSHQIKFYGTAFQLPLDAILIKRNNSCR